MTRGDGVVVAGDGELAAAVAERLRAADGLDVAAVTAPVAAVDRLPAEPPDCLVVVAGPDSSDPLATIRRASEADAAVPIVVVAREGAVDAPAALDAGADEFVPAATAARAPRLLARRVRAAAEGAGDVRDDDGAASGDGRRLVDHLAVPVWVLRDGVVEDANPACADLLGTDRKRLVGTPVADFVAPADRETVADHWETLAGGEAAERVDVVTLVGPWDERGLVEVAGRRLDDGGVAGSLREVTGTRLAERRFEALFAHLDSPVAEIDLDRARATVRRVNPAFEDVFGVAGEDLAGRPLDEHVVPLDEDARERALDVYVRAERGEAVSAEVERATADGRRAFHLQALPYDGVDGTRAVLVYAGGGDRTARERRLTEVHTATRDLLAATGRDEVARIGVESLEEVLDVPVTVVYGYDETQEALVPFAASDGARALYGEVPTVRRGDGPTWYVYEMGDPLRTDDVQAMASVADPDRPVRSELLVPLGDHGVLAASATSVGVFDETDEALARTLGSTLEAAFDRAEREALLRERETELRRQNERLEEFAGIVSHDLRSPLAVVKGNASLLREKGDAAYLDRIEGAADRMDALIEDLLALARQGRAVDEPEYVDLCEVAQKAWGTVDTRTAALDADVDASIEADPGRLRQLFENLFANAVEHGGDDVTVRVTVLESDADDDPGGRYGTAVDGFAVADDGPGLPDEELDDLFEPGATTDETGTGFGLAIVDRIAEAHGWDVAAGESDAGGARFAFTGVEGV